MNVLWIYCDELRADALGCYGRAGVELRTPHLDALAAGGVRFANSFCTSPVCVASRMSTMTGLYPQQTGVYNNEAAWPPYVVGSAYMTLPRWLAEHGYRNADFGKMHLPREVQPWDLQLPQGGGMRELADGVDVITTPGPMRTLIGGRYPGDRPYPPEQVTDNTIDWLRAQDSAGPWIVRASYLQPHTPVFPPPPYDTLYADADFGDSLEMRGTPSAFERCFAATMGADRLTPEQIRATRVQYYGLVAWVDAQVGRLVAALDTLGLRDSTMIVFGADHGASLGENGAYAKHLFTPASHRVPFILNGPGVPAGTVDTGICEGLDLARTCCEAAGIAPHPQFRGRSLLSQPAPDAVHSVIGYGHPGSRAFPNHHTGTWHDGRGWPRRACIRTDRYRLDMNVRMDGEPVAPADSDPYLADWQADPTEATNLADSPAHAHILADLSARIHAHLADSIEPDLDTMAIYASP